jgi:hypothetical protein
MSPKGLPAGESPAGTKASGFIVRASAQMRGPADVCQWTFRGPLFDWTQGIRTGSGL